MKINTCQVCKGPLTLSERQIKEMVMDIVTSVDTVCKKCGAFYRVLDPAGTIKYIGPTKKGD